MTLPTDRSRIEPRLVKLALKFGWRYRLRPGNQESIPPGSLSHDGPGAGGTNDKEFEHGTSNEGEEGRPGGAPTTHDTACGRW